jgi:hypothetical protein
VIKKGVGNPLCFGVENRGFFLVPEVIIYESLCDHQDDNALRYTQLGGSVEVFNTLGGSPLSLAHGG